MALNGAIAMQQSNQEHIEEHPSPTDRGTIQLEVAIMSREVAKVNDLEGAADITRSTDAPQQP